VQQEAVLIIEPIFEADFENCSYGFRPGRNAHQALEEIAAPLKASKTEVYDADLEGYFGYIPHDKLMKCVRMRVVDGAVLRLIKQWLEAPVVEQIRDEGNRASHLVILCNKVTPRLESFVTEKIEQWLGLKINRDKTRIYEVKASENGLDFLGYNFKLTLAPHGPKRRYWRVAPSKKSIQREIARLREMISNRQQHIPITELIGQLNLHLRGWKNYYGKWHCGAAMRRINWHLENRLRRHLRRRSQRPWRIPEGSTLIAHLSKLGLARL
jgi:RNA-directed DNA polymerase